MQLKNTAGTFKLMEEMLYFIFLKPVLWKMDEGMQTERAYILVSPETLYKEWDEKEAALQKNIETEFFTFLAMVIVNLEVQVLILIDSIIRLMP